MDVRCDRCQTEYELDDAVVTETGASVQCTACGHTFIVTRASAVAPMQSTTPPAGSPGTEPDAPPWTLTTEDGRVHRFRDMSTLHRWIVERKVTRADRLTHTSGPPTLLGDVAELAPFFQVVEEADRVRVAPGSAPGLAQASAAGQVANVRTPPPELRGDAVRPNRPTPAPSTPPPIPVQARRPVSEDGPTVPDRRLTGAGTPRPLPTVPPSGQRPRPLYDPFQPGGRVGGAVPRSDTRSDADFSAPFTRNAPVLDVEIARPNRTRNIVFGVLAVAVLGGGGYWLWASGSGHGDSAPSVADNSHASGNPAARGTTSPAAGSAPSTTASAGTTAPGASANAASASGSTAAPGGPAGATATAGAAAPGTTTAAPGATTAAAAATGAGGAAPASPAGAAVANKGPGDALGGAGGSHAAAGIAPKGAAGYERLVADADKLMLRGQSAKAGRLYDQALSLRPDGVAAITGSAYVLLDHQRHLKAIETFRRAIQIQPTYGPALFGVGEAYRARGDRPQALDAYKQYLAAAPGGTDAPAARRQIKDLEAATSAPGGGARAGNDKAPRTAAAPAGSDEEVELNP